MSRDTAVDAEECGRQSPCSTGAGCWTRGDVANSCRGPSKLRISTPMSRDHENWISVNWNLGWVDGQIKYYTLRLGKSGTEDVLFNSDDISIKVVACSPRARPPRCRVRSRRPRCCWPRCRPPCPRSCCSAHPPPPPHPQPSPRAGRSRTRGWSPCPARPWAPSTWAEELQMKVHTKVRNHIEGF